MQGQEWFQFEEAVLIWRYKLSSVATSPIDLFWEDDVASITRLRLTLL